ncbi:hypothetical protein PMAYCL1PPCAC_11530 [Pristionchus mayeri]|uniref:Transmembrane protein 177 n=1 Tax=Pristionchus mayeri TaxID=1317129 RepID=A0AAN4ZPD0_9BILA|nr:hypothetical protein PMAYCL1PPCAC_11530 [Pristionchus mayeri]
MWTYAQWVRQVYLGCIPAYPIGYLLVHCVRDDFFFTKFYVKRSDLAPSEHLKEIVENEFDNLEGDVQHPRLHVTLTDSLEPSVFGGFFLKNGAEIQFPLAASFVDIEYARRLGGHIEMDFGQTRNRRKLENSSSIAEEMLTRMMLSEKAKKFIVQSQLQRANDGLLFSLPLFGWAALSTAGYPMLLMLSRFIGFTASFVASLGGATLAYRELLKKLEGFAALRTDEKTVRMGRQYEEGAREYLATQMAVGRMLKKVMGSEGKLRIAKNGDLLADAVPYSRRLRAIDQLNLMEAEDKEID